MVRGEPTRTGDAPNTSTHLCRDRHFQALFLSHLTKLCVNPAFSNTTIHRSFTRHRRCVSHGHFVPPLHLSLARLLLPSTGVDWRIFDEDTSPPRTSATASMPSSARPTPRARAHLDYDLTSAFAATERPAPDSRDGPNDASITVPPPTHPALVTAPLSLLLHADARRAYAHVFALLCRVRVARRLLADVALDLHALLRRPPSAAAPPTPPLFPPQQSQQPQQQAMPPPLADQLLLLMSFRSAADAVAPPPLLLLLPSTGSRARSRSVPRNAFPQCLTWCLMMLRTRCLLVVSSTSRLARPSPSPDLLLKPRFAPKDSF